MLAPVMMAGSMSLIAIVEAQKNLWFVVLQPVGLSFMSLPAWLK